MTSLDETDLRILNLLQDDSRMTNKELAAKIHLSPTPTFERVKRLEREGYIKKYMAVLDAEKINRGFIAFCSFPGYGQALRRLRQPGRRPFRRLDPNRPFL